MVDLPPRRIEPAGVKPVIRNGYCIGCGACAALPDAQHKVEVTAWGTLVASMNGLTPGVEARAARLCPFSDLAANETEIAKELFPDNRTHETIGSFHEAFAGYVIEGGFRDNGSSGGMGTWILEQLLSTGRVDAVVHVGGGSGERGTLFQYRVSRTVQELRSGAKSRYYPVTLADVVPEVRQRPGRYAFVGVPCFVKAIRLLAKEDPSFGASVAFCVSLVCGHFKSRGYAEFLGWQMGIHPSSLERIDFRVKVEGDAANYYGVRVSGRDGNDQIERTSRMDDLYGHDWGMGLFKPKACDFCDDVVGETADITIGDAWLPQYVQDSRGTNLIIVRNSSLAGILHQAAADGRINLEAIDPGEVARSQGSAYVHRREGLAYRLLLADTQNQWRPIKRVRPSQPDGGAIFERRQRLRSQLAEGSHDLFLRAKQAGDLNVFFRSIAPLAERYRDTYRPLWKRVLHRVHRFLRGDARIRRAARNASTVNRVGGA